MVDKDIKKLRKQIKEKNTKSSSCFDTTSGDRKSESINDTVIEKSKNVERVIYDTSIKTDNVEEDNVEKDNVEEKNNNPWLCDYCNKDFNTQSKALQHEKDCAKNPDNQIDSDSSDNEYISRKISNPLNPVSIAFMLIGLGVIILVGGLIFNALSDSLSTTVEVQGNVNIESSIVQTEDIELSNVQTEDIENYTYSYSMGGNESSLYTLFDTSSSLFIMIIIISIVVFAFNIIISPVR